MKDAQKWISVDDRLPKEKVNCIVYFKHAYCGAKMDEKEG